MRAHAELVQVRFGGDESAMSAEEADDGGIEGGGEAGEGLGSGCSR